eukprot:scaffold118341_cov63-Phaeocystis_antarctica.AAC.6
MGSACLVVWSSASKPADQPSRPPPTGSLGSGGVCTTPVCLTPLNPIRLIRKLAKPQEVGGLGASTWWESSSGAAAAGAATAMGSSVTAGIGKSAAGASMSDQRLSAISASRSSALLAKLMNLARFRGRLSYLEGGGSARVESATVEAVFSSTRGSSWGRWGAQGRQARPEEAREPN